MTPQAHLQAFSTMPSQEFDAISPELILGAAIFDLNGLPKEYFVTSGNSDINWIQTIFQALGLRSLLTASLRLEGFHYAVIRGVGRCAIVVKQRSCYTALLIRQTDPQAISNLLIRWIQELEPSQLRADPRFCLA